MKTVITVFFLMINFQIYSQNLSISSEVVYEQTISNNDGILSKEYKLIFNNQESYYEEVISKEYKKGQDRKEDGTIVLNIRDNQNPQFYYNSKEKGFYFSQIVYNQHLFVKDNFIINWNLSNEIKRINDIKCQKATTKFRGREYVAWFTNKIPISFGPWKLNGLSGLILEVYDTTGYFRVVAKKIRINLNKNDTIKIPLIDTNKAMSINEFKKQTSKLEADFISRLNSKLPKGIKPFKIDKNCEDCPKPLEIFDEEN
ncbi:MAG: hypothetical protein COB60_06360 [Flavobacteriaceae bacterium]|nr:MAG: hypothetical protein COB60_06360 [Flavobacteriaceae bacterium]